MVTIGPTGTDDPARTRDPTGTEDTANTGKPTRAQVATGTGKPTRAQVATGTGEPTRAVRAPACNQDSPGRWGSCLRTSQGNSSCPAGSVDGSSLWRLRRRRLALFGTTGSEL